MIPRQLSPSERKRQIRPSKGGKSDVGVTVVIDEQMLRKLIQMNITTFAVRKVDTRVFMVHKIAGRRYVAR